MFVCLSYPLFRRTDKRVGILKTHSNKEDVSQVEWHPRKQFTLAELEKVDKTVSLALFVINPSSLSSPPATPQNSTVAKSAAAVQQIPFAVDTLYKRTVRS